jgi:preprotein translocase subunit SecB
MAEPTPPLHGDAPADTPRVTQRVLTQYIRDLSFENKATQKGFSADDQQILSAEVDVETHKLEGDKQYEVVTRLGLTNKLKSDGNPIFLIEVEYAGRFEIDGLTGEQLDAYLATECPRVTFPFVRRIVGNLILDGGFAPLNLQTIDFQTVYRKKRESGLNTEPRN